MMSERTLQLHLNWNRSISAKIGVLHGMLTELMNDLYGESSTNIVLELLYDL